MSLRIPLTTDQTLQTEFHEIERRLRRLEKQAGIAPGATTTRIFKSEGGNGTSTINLGPILLRLEALETAVANIPDVDDIEIPFFGAVGVSSAAGIVPEPGVKVPPTGLAEHVLKEDATWGFPFRGLINVCTDGRTEPTDIVELLGGLEVQGPLLATDAECRDLTVHNGLRAREDLAPAPPGVGEHVLRGDGMWAQPLRGLVQVATSGTHTEPPYEVLNVEGGLTSHSLATGNLECFDLRTQGEVEYGDTFWDDLRFPAQGINPVGAATDPGVDDDTGMLAFSGILDNVIAGVAQMPHGYRPGTSVYPHLHLRFPTSAAANTRWQFEYDIANIGGNFTNASGTYTTLSTITEANPQNVNTHVIASFGELSMTGFIESAVILWKISRLAASDVLDTDTSDCLLMEFDFHYQITKPGTGERVPE